MSSSDDIANLFRQFGRSPAHYQEIGRDDRAREGRQRWPLLAAIDPGAAPPPPATESRMSGVPGGSAEPLPAAPVAGALGAAAVLRKQPCP